MALFHIDDLAVRKQESVEIWQVLPLLLAAVLLTIGLAMFLSGTERATDVVQPVIVVFGGTLVALLVTFPLTQLSQALQAALVRGVRGGTDPLEMIRAMMKICDISRREGLLGVADVRSNMEEVEEVCQLIGDAATEPAIRFSLERRRSGELTYHRMAADVFLFTACYAGLIGALGTLIRLVPVADTGLAGGQLLPFVCGLCLAILMTILLGRLRAAHLRELVVVDVAYGGASIILEDNHVQRLSSRLRLLVPPGLRR